MTPNPTQLLQINLISARDLTPVSKAMCTYAIVWMNPSCKLTGRVDPKGGNCPQWNDKFLFRHPDMDPTTNLNIHIYARSWLRDTVVGSVQVPAASIIPQGHSRRRAVALQIRRSCGRPRGILNITVSILDGTQRSLPLSTLDVGSTPTKTTNNKLRRVKSQRPLDEPNVGGFGGSLCSSVGPSPSVVAAAVAKGVYSSPPPPPSTARDDGESSILQWADDDSEEELMSKIERWRRELEKKGGNIDDRRRGHDHDDDGKGARQKRGHRRRKSEGVRLFRCFGNGYGFEFTIVCGANNQHHNHNHNNHNHKRMEHRKKVYLDSSTVDSSNSSYTL